MSASASETLNSSADGCVGDDVSPLVGWSTNARGPEARRQGSSLVEAGGLAGSFVGRCWAANRCSCRIDHSSAAAGCTGGGLAAVFEVDIGVGVDTSFDVVVVEVGMAAVVVDGGNMTVFVDMAAAAVEDMMVPVEVATGCMPGPEVGTHSTRPQPSRNMVVGDRDGGGAFAPWLRLCCLLHSILYEVKDGDKECRVVEDEDRWVFVCSGRKLELERNRQKQWGKKAE